jgi:uncharacterized protein
MVQRAIKKQVQQAYFKGKVILLLGARQVGKTTLLQELQDEFDGDTLWLNADEADIRLALNNATTSSQLFQLFGKAKLIIIDEAQMVSDIGLKLKLYIDTKPKSQIIVSGSSVFELLNKTNEPLTGRKIDFHLHPLSYAELVQSSSAIAQNRLLETRLVYGSYPEIVNNPGNEMQLLK